MRATDIAKATKGELFGETEASCTFVSTDSRTIEKGALFVALRGDKFDGNQYIAMAYEKGAAAAIGNVDFTPPKGRAYVKTEDSLAALGQLAAFHRAQFSIPVVGITGSVGKTTTKEMIAAALGAKFTVCKTEGNFNNHIGLPLSMLRLSDAHEAAVFEMGMSAKGEIAYLTSLATPDVAVITNIGVSHMETLGSQENIRDAKLEIAEGLSKDGVLLVNGDDAFLKDVTIPGKTVLRYGFENPKCEILGTIENDTCFSVFGTRVWVPVSGKHNLYNALAAVSVGKALGIPVPQAAEGLLSYKTDGIRQSEKEIRPGITVLCDYYNASPPSMSAALEMLRGGKAKRRIAVLGDMLELGEIGPRCHHRVGEEAGEKGIDMVLTVGPLSRHIATGARENGVKYVESFSDNETLSAYLIKILSAGDRVLIKGSHGMKMEEIFEKIR